MREFLEDLARALVDAPDQVKVESFEEDDGTLVLELSVAEDDYGKIIGRGGRDAPAPRTGGQGGGGEEKHRRAGGNCGGRRGEGGGREKGEVWGGAAYV